MHQENETIRPGKYVAIAYTIYDQEGSTLEYNDVPMGYVYGGSQILIGGMEEAVFGKRVGDRIEMMVPPERGFGDHDPSLVYVDDINNVPEEFHYIGAEVEMQNEETGDIKKFFVTRIADGRLTMDGNHPMAGKTLRIQIRILQVREATPEDMQGNMTGTHVYH